MYFHLSSKESGRPSIERAGGPAWESGVRPLPGRINPKEILLGNDVDLMELVNGDSERLS